MPVIFVALGTHEQPFERALDLVTPLVKDDELVIQHGHTPPRMNLEARWVEFAPYETILQFIEFSDAVVCHAGVGTIMSTLGAGKCPIVIPRQAQFGEHVDDHQLQIAHEFAARGIVIEVQSGDDVSDCVARARNITATRTGRVGDLIAAVADATKPSRPRPTGARANAALEFLTRNRP